MKRILLSFGKYAGKPITQVDDDYLRWLQANTESPWWRRLAAQVLEERHKKDTTEALLAELKTCSRRRDLERGREIHAFAVQSGSVSDVYVASCLVNMYAKCGVMASARHVFDSVNKPDIVCWNALISGYVENGEGSTALDLFATMRSQQDCVPNSLTLISALKACLALDPGECRKRRGEIHTIASVVGCGSDIYVQNRLIDMYAKCGSISEAHKVFSDMKERNTGSWNTLVSGYADIGEGLTALDLFAAMRSQGIAPDSITIVAALKACASLAVKQRVECRERGRQVHVVASEIGCDLDPFVQNALVDMYAKGGSMAEAQKVFDSMKKPDLISWNALLLGYAENAQGITALDLLSRMRYQGYVPDSITIVGALKACISLAAKQNGRRLEECRERVREVHSLASELGCSSDMFVQSTLMDTYAKCGSMEDAWTIFETMKHPDVVSWNTLIFGYVENGNALTALDSFTRMRSQGCAANSLTFVAALKACTSLAQKQDWDGRREHGERIHELASSLGHDSDVSVQNILIDMYAKYGCMKQAHRIFSNMKRPDVVSWTALIMGYATNGESLVALDSFTNMTSQGCTPDSRTYVAVLKACSTLGALEFGRNVHARADSFDLMLVNSLVDFYGKCGSMAEAQMVFDLHSRTRDLATWNSLLAGYSRLGDTKAAFSLFNRMHDACLKPDNITFTCLLTCCSHAGLVVKAKDCFDAMSAKYGILPSLEHYTCMADVLGRSNKLDEAMALLQAMPHSPDVVTWLTVLGACRKWKNAEIGRLAFESLVGLDATVSAAYVLMAHIYGSSGMWEEKEAVLAMRRRLGASKKPGQSWWTNELGEVHTFLVDSGV